MLWKWQNVHSILYVQMHARTCSEISMSGAIKLHPFGMLKGCNFIDAQSSNCIILLVHYFIALTVEQFLIQVSSEVRHFC